MITSGPFGTNAVAAGSGFAVALPRGEGDGVAVGAAVDGAAETSAMLAKTSIRPSSRRAALFCSSPKVIGLFLQRRRVAPCSFRPGIRALGGARRPEVFALHRA